MKKSNIVIASLERATERVKSMSEQVNRLGIENVHFYKCFDGKCLINPTFAPKISLPGGYRNGSQLTSGEVGCGLSHVGILTMAKAMNWEHVIVFEDDITICEDFEKRIDYLLTNAPKDWEHIFLSGDPSQKPIAPGLLQIIPSVRTNCTHSYMVRNTAYDKMIEKLSSMETTPDDLITHLIFHEKKIKSYTFYPFTTYVNTTYSYIWDKNAAHNVVNSSKTYFVNKLF